VPMRPGLRSINVAVAAAMILGEALRQTKAFPTSPLAGESLPSGCDPRVERAEGGPAEEGNATSPDKSALPPSPQPSPIEGEGERAPG
jgi:hypothetical protein